MNQKLSLLINYNLLYMHGHAYVLQYFFFFLNEEGRILILFLIILFIFVSRLTVGHLAVYFGYHGEHWRATKKHSLTPLADPFLLRRCTVSAHLFW